MGVGGVGGVRSQMCSGRFKSSRRLTQHKRTAQRFGGSDTAQRHSGSTQRQQRELWRLSVVLCDAGQRCPALQDQRRCAACERRLAL